MESNECVITADLEKIRTLLEEVARHAGFKTPMRYGDVIPKVKEIMDIISREGREEVLRKFLSAPEQQGHNPEILPPEYQRYLMSFVVREIKQESFQELERKLAPPASTSNRSALSGSNGMPSGANLTEESRELQSDGRAASATTGPKKRAFIAPHCSISTGGHVLRDHTGKQAIDDGQPHDDSPVYLSCGYPKRNPTTRIIFPGKRTSDHISVQQTFRNSRTVGNFKPNRFCVVIWTVSTRPPSTGPHPLPRRPYPYPTGAGYGRPGAGAPLPATTAANAALVAGGAGGDVQHCRNPGDYCDAFWSVLSLHRELVSSYSQLTGQVQNEDGTFGNTLRSS
eukprot:GHVU01042058.1.p1 GENE.GHVU01042058.1~~GHVU01042058.1.p1  ORF type:complete len:340 (+),score=25.83 GHVU01042058.1:78-1097(+)